MNAPRLLRMLLLAGPLVGGLACSSDSKRDQFYGTDAGAGWKPEAGDLVQPHDAAEEAGTADGGVLDGSQDGVRDGGDAAALDGSADQTD